MQAQPGDAPQLGGGGYQGAHPIAAFFQVIFKVGAILTFALGNAFGGSYVGIFISVVLMLSADFWASKNITGRILVSLRWWNDVKEDGTNEWVFESAPVASSVNRFDSYFFWVTTYGNVVLWAVLVFFNITSLSTLPMAVLGFILGIANAIGYTKCDRDAKKKFSSFMMRQAANNPGIVRAAVTA
ncbi:transmembrane protein, putative [Bodo saltans]|uniref:Golgi apparatus membrane protein TVP23 homolog n=1 Tax=Bodo saltans TaxID=75058 RepID=A0A0S4JUW4_BODSA|nr:transmembrane protein, putative [Bodo saltans]|eukprot:CUG92361.1 transmembrane protein, putative [Bodo saltans]